MQVTRRWCTGSAPGYGTVGRVAPAPRLRGSPNDAAGSCGANARRATGRTSPDRPGARRHTTQPSPPLPPLQRHPRAERCRSVSRRSACRAARCRHATRRRAGRKELQESR